MTTSRLAKLYDRLTPRERLPLLVAASARGDEAEAHRLARAAPRACHRLPDYHGLAEGLVLLALFHVMRLLELAGLFWRTTLLHGGLAGRRRGTEQAEAQVARVWSTARMHAYVFTVERDGWRRYCAELGIDGEVLLRDVPGYDTLAHAEGIMREAACTPEEADRFLRARDEGARAPRVEDAVAEMREFVRRRVEWWD